MLPTDLPKSWLIEHCYRSTERKANMRVLLIEDDRRLTRLMEEELREEHYSVDVAHDGEIGLELALRGAHDIAIVDWMLPRRDGPSIVRAMRAAQLATPVLMLTARGQVEDRVAGLDAGADDYLVKPFAFKELLARLRALARRPAAAATSDELRCAAITLDLRGHTARCGDVVLDLTATEWNLLECLIRHAGQALTRQQILDYVWSYQTDVQETMVDVYVSYLRRKLKTAAGTDLIDTVRGVGYRMECPA
jgi:two-component system, OmpR family, response regulator